MSDIYIRSNNIMFSTFRINRINEEQQVSPPRDLENFQKLTRIIQLPHIGHAVYHIRPLLAPTRTQIEPLHQTGAEDAIVGCVLGGREITGVGGEDVCSVLGVGEGGVDGGEGVVAGGGWEAGERAGGGAGGEGGGEGFCICERHSFSLFNYISVNGPL